MLLYIDNISLGLSPEKLKDAFSAYSPQWAAIHKKGDGECLFGYVYIHRAADCLLASKEMHGLRIGNKKLSVSLAMSKVIFRGRQKHRDDIFFSEKKPSELFFL